MSKGTKSYEHILFWSKNIKREQIQYLKGRTSKVKLTSLT